MTRLMLLGTLLLCACEDGSEPLGLVDGGAGVDSGPYEPSPPDPDCESTVEGEQRGITNTERVGAGLDPLACDGQMVQAARLHAEDMCANGYFSHTSQDGRDFGQRMRAQGVSFGAGGENIARGQRTPAAVHQTWMNSDGHRRNIMNPRYTRIGVGHADCGGSPYWVQVFAD